MLHVTVVVRVVAVVAISIVKARMLKVCIPRRWAWHQWRGWGQRQHGMAIPLIVIVIIIVIGKVIVIVLAIVRITIRSMITSFLGVHVTRMVHVPGLHLRCWQQRIVQIWGMSAWTFIP